VLPLPRIFVSAWHGLRTGRGTLALAFAILTASLAAGTVTFSIVDSVVLRELPYGTPEQLVGVSMPGAKPGSMSAVTPEAYFSWVDGAQAFIGLAASSPRAPLRFETSGQLDSLITRKATANLFDVLEVTPAAGRLFHPGDDRGGGPSIAILSYELWNRRFGADRSIVGRTINFGDDVREIIGVLPPGLWYPLEQSPPDIYVPYVATAADRANSRIRSLAVVGRLRPQATVEQGRADLQRLSSVAINVAPLHSYVVGSARPWLFLVLGAVAFVILSSCVNVAALFLVRAATRESEFAIREALGESRLMIGGGLLVEGVLMALSAGVVALGLSQWGLEMALSRIPPGTISRLSSVAIDHRVLGISILTAATCGALFSSGPAWLFSRSDLFGVMKSGGAALIGERRIERFLAVCLVGEVMVVSMLLVGSVLIVGSFVRITTADLGFDRRNIAVIPYERVYGNADTGSRQLLATSIRRELLERARAVPGVVDVAISTNASVPLAGGGVRYSINIPGVGETTGEDMLETRMVTPEYFRVMGMQLLSGRLFTAEDDAFGAPSVILINDVAVKRFFPDQDPIGRIVTFRGPATIVGVLRAVHFNGPEATARPEMYVPANQEVARGPSDFGSLLVRLTGNPTQVATAVRDSVRLTLASEPGAAQFVEDLFERLTAARRFNANVMSVLGLMAIALAVTGVYGTLQFIVTRQWREIGLRMALGASGRRLIQTVVWNAIRLVVAGLALGLAGAWLTSNTLRSLLFGVRSTEPSLYALVATIIVALAFCAAAIPAARAVAIDPSKTLRHE